MKDLIVLAATILLGVAIAALVVGLGTTAEKVKNKANDSILNQFSITSSVILQNSDFAV